MRTIQVIETASLFLAIFSLWPVILGWQHVGWKVFMYVMLAAMVAIFVRRWRAYRRLLSEQFPDKHERRRP